MHGTEEREEGNVWRGTCEGELVEEGVLRIFPSEWLRLPALLSCDDERVNECRSGNAYVEARLPRGAMNKKWMS